MSGKVLIIAVIAVAAVGGAAVGYMIGLFGNPINTDDSTGLDDKLCYPYRAGSELVFSIYDDGQSVTKSETQIKYVVTSRTDNRMDVTATYKSPEMVLTYHISIIKEGFERYTSYLNDTYLFHASLSGAHWVFHDNWGSQEYINKTTDIQSLMFQLTVNDVNLYAGISYSGEHHPVYQNQITIQALNALSSDSYYKYFAVCRGIDDLYYTKMSDDKSELVNDNLYGIYEKSSITLAGHEFSAIKSEYQEKIFYSDTESPHFQEQRINFYLENGFLRIYEEVLSSKYAFFTKIQLESIDLK